MLKDCPEFGWGKWQLIETGNKSVFAHRCEWNKSVVVAIYNLADEACTVNLDLGESNAEYLIDLLSDRQYQPIVGSAYTVELQGYGYRWLRVGGGLGIRKK
ncbi:MAG: alpha-glucosidase C-terminal domain-containing protein [Rhizonema sp. PD38]|nr:alpha-glucosidase C-terminal domain-containing protein [Rhizonema sp. PD38]